MINEAYFSILRITMQSDPADLQTGDPYIEAWLNAHMSMEHRGNMDEFKDRACALVSATGDYYYISFDPDTQRYTIFSTNLSEWR